MREANSFYHSSSGYRPSLGAAIAVVVALHGILLAGANYWEPAPPQPKARSKVIVQTVSLNPSRPAIAQRQSATPKAPAAPPAAPQAEAVVAAKVEVPPSLPKGEEIALKEDSHPKEIAAIAPLAPPPQPSPPAPTPSPITAAPAPAPAPTPVKSEAKPAPKPAVQEKPKQEIKPPAPPTPKKAAEPAKKPEKAEAEKAKQKEEAEKKKLQDQAEKKKLEEKAEAEKKKLLEKTEAEKKKQLEKAEAEKKRQQEIAAAEKKRQLEIAAKNEEANQKMAKLRENLAKMNDSRGKIAAAPSTKLESTALPKEIALQVDALPLEDAGSSRWGSSEAKYSDGVAFRLKNNLKLPDYGEIRIKLTLDRTGKVKKVETIKSESSKNKAYVEKNILNIQFSSFGQQFPGVDQNTFVITLQNDS